jgi:hypothetical protein
MVVTPSIPNKGVVLSNEPRESATVKKTNPPERANKGKAVVTEDISSSSESDLHPKDI